MEGLEDGSQRRVRRTLFNFGLYQIAIRSPPYEAWTPPGGSTMKLAGLNTSKTP